MAKNGHRQLDLADGVQGGRRVRILDSDILRHVGARAMEAGRIYTRQGRIVSFEERPPEISALVRGSSAVPYRVSVTVTPAESAGVRIQGRCSCPVGAYCKHVAAVLIESRLRHPGVAATRQGQLFVAQPDPPASESELLPLPISHWIAALERAQASDGEDFPPEAQNRLVYVFSLPVYGQATPQLMVEAVSARLLKNGGFSNSFSRPELSTLFSESPPKYIRPSDVNITRLLSMERGTAYGAPIRLKDEAAWEIIEAALATGRARLDSVHGASLALGPDRTGKVAWKLGDDANLRPAIEVEDGLTPFVAAPSGYLNRASGVVGRLDLGIEPKIAAAVLAAPPVPARFAATVAGLIEQRAPRAAAARPASSEPPLRVEQSPTPVLRLFKADLPIAALEDAFYRRHYPYRAPQTETVALARLSFRYGAAHVPHGEAKPVVTRARAGDRPHAGGRGRRCRATDGARSRQRRRRAPGNAGAARARFLARGRRLRLVRFPLSRAATAARRGFRHRGRRGFSPSAAARRRRLRDRASQLLGLRLVRT